MSEGKITFPCEAVVEPKMGNDGLHLGFNDRATFDVKVFGQIVHQITIEKDGQIVTDYLAKLGNEYLPEGVLAKIKEMYEEDIKQAYERRAVCNENRIKSLVNEIERLKLETETLRARR